MRFRIFAAVLASAFGEDVEAQSTAQQDTTTRLPGVTITAARHATPILTTPLAVSKISVADLRAVSGFGLDDALSQVPGVIAQSRYGTSDVRLIIRGFGARGAGDRSNAGTSRGIRVLIDGMPETEPDGRTAFDQVDLASTEGVEVIRSNASALWGNAAGGVINFLTVPSVTKPVFDIQPIFGGFGLKRYALRAAAPVGNGVAYAHYTNTSFEGWRAHSSARRVMMNAGVVGMVGGNTRVGFYASGADNLFRIPGPLTQAQVDADPNQANATYKARDERRYNRVIRLGSTVEHDFDSRTSLSAMFYVSPKYLQRSERGTYRDFTRYHIGANVIGKREMTLTPTVRSRLAVGVDEAFQDGAILFYTLDSLPDGSRTRGPTLSDNKGEGANNFGVFAQDELVFGEKLSATIGARYDVVNYYYRSFLPAPPIRSDRKEFSRLTPKLGVSWLLSPSRSVYANMGGGIEVPAGNETDPTPGAPPALLNPLLDAIRSTTVEVGYKSMDTRLGGSPVTATYDVALYTTSVTNEIVPYNGGRFYLTAAKAKRSGAELGLSAHTDDGVFANIAFTYSHNRYTDYVVDSALLGKPGATADYSDNKVIGVPDVFANVELGTEMPGYRALRVKAALEHSGAYFADDVNSVRVPGYSILNLTAELRAPIVSANGWGLRGFITVHNVSNKKYIGSAFLNPDKVAGVPVAFEPGMPRSVIVSLSAGRM